MTPSSRTGELIERHVLGILTEDEACELAEILSREESSDERRRLRLSLRADAYLQEAAAEMPQLPAPSPPQPLLTVLSWLGMAAALVLSLVAWMQTS